MEERADILKNIQINEVIGEKEKFVLFYGKNHTVFGQPIVTSVG